MKRNNTFKKWIALFLSVAMVAVSGVTTNTSMSAAESTGVQESAAADTTDGTAAADADETTVANVDQNDTTRTEEIGLNGTDQAAEESAAPSEEENKNAETAAEAEQGTTPATVADSENKETAADSTASSSVSSSSEEEDKNLTASEQIDEARKDATKREYSYEDDLVSVTATLDDPKAVPDNAEFRVTPVTKDSTAYNYEAYMNALNDDAAASSDSDTEKQYTDENTLLYDMAFIYPVEEKDEDGNVTQKEVEVQPAEGAVKISVNFKKDQLTKSLDAEKDSDVEIKHLPLIDAVKESNDTTADATNISADDVKVEDVKNADVSVEDRTLSFKVKGFSVYAVTKEEQEHSGIEEGTSRDYKSILGDAVEYGIVADKYIQKNHTQTNFAVNEYYRDGDNVIEADIAGPQDVPFYIGDFSSNGLRFGGSTNSNSVIYDVYTKDTKSNISIDNTQKITVNRLTSEYNSDYVTHLIATVADMSNKLAGDSNVNTLKEENVDQNNYIIDTRSAGDNATIYFNVNNNDTGFLNAMNCSGGIRIRKKSGQTIIFNILKDSEVTLKQFQYAIGDDNYTVTSTDQSDSDKNKKLDQQVCQKIIWNFVNATTVDLDTTAGTILAPKANVNSNNTSQGWVVAGGTVITNSEWHFAYHERKYHSMGNAFFTAKKVLLVNNQEQRLSAGEFKFALYQGKAPSADAEPVEEATNNSDGLISFDKLTYNQDDVKDSPITYTVKEIAGTDKAINYDTTTYTIKVYLKDDNNGKINTAVKLVNKDGEETPLTSAEQMTFTNTKNSEATGSVTFSGTKTLNGRSLKNDEFAFDLKDADGKILQTVKNDKDGKIVFGEIKYAEAGTYTYTISEESTQKAGVTIDDKVYDVKVTVTDDGSGQLKASVEGLNADGSGADFTNSYNAKSASVTLGGHKYVDGTEQSDEPFTFTLSENGKVIDTVERTGAGDYRFSPITYEKAGEHVYKVAETKGNTAGYTYDDKTYTVNVNVVDGENGQLKAEISGDAKTGTDLDFTNTYKADGTSVTFSGTKTLNGRSLKNDEFAFDLKDADGKILQTVKNDKDGKIVFGEIKYAEAGTYTYTISEESTQKAGVTIDDKVYDVKVTVTDDGSGQLKASVEGLNADGSGADFTNSYNAKSASVTLGGHKYVDGTEQSDEPFTFTLSENGKVIDTVERTGAGDYRFSPITYEKAGEHVYKVAETKGNTAGYTYDDKTYTVNVNVVDGENGQLKAEISGDAKTGTDLDFTNTYKADGTSVTFSGTKTLNGRSLKNDEFAFDLKDADGKILQTVKNDKDGKIVFGEIKYAEAGTYTYTISEESTQKAGVTIDDKVYDVKVTVTDDGSGQLKASVEGLNADGSGADFTNSYNAKSASVTLGGHKYVDGTEQSDEPFTFTLSENGKVIDTVERTGAGDYRFSPITYEKAGEHVYKVAETKGNTAGYTYDDKTYTVNVNVVDGENGQLKAEISGDAKTGTDLDFTNTYKADGTSVTFSGTKTLNGRSLKNDEFAFDLKDADGKILQTVKNDKDGKIVFGEIKYAEAGTYTYTISEESTQKAGVTIDDKVYDVKVTVTDDGSGQLKASVEGLNADGSGADFENSFNAKSASVSLGGLKTVEGIENSDKAFSFTLSEGDTILQTVTRAGAGEYRFESLTYDKAGEHTYTVAEKKGTAEGYTYDDKIYTVKVNVTDDGNGQLKAEISGDTKTGTDLNFTNTYEAKAASAVISGTKTLNGVPASVAGQFRFDLFDANGKRIDTAANDEKGNFIFGRLHFEKAGVYTYTIKEQNAGEIIDGIRYQNAARTVTITVKDDGNGHLVANNATAAAFDNEKYGTITVGKNWNDAGNEKYRPSTVVVDLIDAATGETVQKAELSEVNNWTATFDQLVPGGRYTVHEDENSEYYAAENNDQVVTADANGTQVTLVNDFVQPAVTIYANKVLNGGTLANGEFTFNLYRNSDPDTVVKTATNNASGEIFFTDIAYDAKGYTVREAAGDDGSIAYDSEAIVYDAKGNITSDHREFTNTQRPIVLRVQKRSKEAPYDPLVGATYGLYQVVEGGNDILVESEISDENGYMYYGRIQPGVIYYFKEIAAPAGHEVDPYPGQKFQVKYTSNGQIALYDENGNPTTVGDITGQDSKNLLVQYTTEKTAVDTSSSLSYSDDSIVAVAKAENSKAFAAGTKLKVTQLSGSEAKTAAAAVEAACGKINSNIAYYDIQFTDASGNEVEPAGGDVTVTIQYKGNLDLPEGTDRTALKLVHLTKEANGETTVEAVPGTVAADQDGLLQTSFTADSFSTFGVVEPGSDNTLGQNYLVTAAGVADQVSELKVAKLDTAGKYIKGAKLQIIEKATGNVMAEWNTADGPQSFARWFDDAKTVPMNVDTYYILHEVSAPDGYQLADDILFMINKYDSSITVYKYDDNGKLVIDQEAIDKWVSDTTLQMIDVPVKHETVTLVKQKLVPNEKTIQGEDKIVHVTSIQAVRTGDTTPIALFVILLAAAAVVLLILVYRGRKKKDS